MAAIAMFGKDKPPVKGPHKVSVSEAQQLSEWLRRGKQEVFTVVTQLTPDLARLLLAHNEGNRPVSQGSAKNRTLTTRSVAAFAAAMQRGEWVLNGAGLAVARTGELNDGQHRCFAVIEAEKAVPVQITFGVERGTRHTLDQGIVRTPGHVLAMDGEVNTNNLACALGLLWSIDYSAPLSSRPSMDQLRATLKSHPHVRDALNAVVAMVKHYRLSQGYLGAAHYLCRKRDAYAADTFLGTLTTGLNIPMANAPVARLRKIYEEHAANRKTLDRAEQAALYIKGINNHIFGRTGPLNWRDEDFPTVGA